VFDHAEPTLSSEHTGEGDTWFCQVTRYLDGVQDGDVLSAEPVVVLVNHPPGAPGVEISVQEDGGLLCLITTPSQDDLEEPIRYSYSWVVFDGTTTAQRSEVGPIVPGQGGADTAGHVWTCRVTPSDGVNIGETGEADYQVPQGECVFSADGARGYKFCSIPLSKEAAQASCEGFGMDLVSVMSAEENAWVSSMAEGIFEGYGAFFQRYWVGLELDSSGSQWYRSGGMGAVYFESAFPESPSSGACGVTGQVFGPNAGAWQDSPCGESHGYVCEDRSYLVDSGSVGLDNRSPSHGTSLTDHGWLATPNSDQLLSYSSDCSLGEVGLSLKTYRWDGQSTGVSVALDQLQADVTAEVWAKPQDSLPMGALTLFGEDGSGNLLEVSLRAKEDGQFECAVGSGDSLVPSGITYMIGDQWYRFLIEVGSDGFARCQVSLEDGTAREISLSVPQGASFNAVGIYSLVAPTAYGTLTYWDDFKVGW